jgi:hypothetical protein
MRVPRGGRGGRMWDPKTVATFAGEVTAVHRMEGRRGTGIHLDLKTAEGTLAVQVGPLSFLEKEGLKLAVGDAIEVTGSRVAMRRGLVVLAQVVKKGSQAVALRDVNGVPVWAGSR